ncbi:MAG: hypothetical protein V2J62_01710 [candidate division KSB1 bacterium]|nr:hypothetical protein [candidate division KSB1 bacterium]
MNNRREYIEKFANQLRKWDTEINELELKTEHAKGELKEKYQKMIHDLRNQKDELREQLKVLNEANENAWSELKRGFEESWENMMESIREAGSYFQK